MKALAIAAILVAIALPAIAHAAARTARCVVESAGAPTWRGPCQFEAERGGSFTISPARGTFANGVGAISLSIGGPNLGEVRGLTRDGSNSRWGIARRSQRDRACWIGEDFSLCVY